MYANAYSYRNKFASLEPQSYLIYLATVLALSFQIQTL